MKMYNVSLMLRILRENAPLSRADIARRTSLTRSTISILVNDALEMGLIKESGFNDARNIGKRPTMLDIRTDKIFVLSIKLSYHNIHMAKLDLLGRIIEYTKQSITMDSAEIVVDAILKMAEKFIDDASANDELFHAIGIAVPSPLRDGIMAFASSFHCLEGVDLKTILSEKFKLSVQVNNDADAAALAETWFGGYPQGADLAFVLVQQGIGCGLIRGQELYTHSSKMSNEFGHIRIGGKKNMCFCGKEGCLAALASDWAISQIIPDKLREQAEKHVPDASYSLVEKMMKHMSDFPSLYTKYTLQASNYLGIGLANLINIYMPDIIVLDGSILDVPRFFDHAKEVCNENIHPMFKDTFKIVRSGLNIDAPLVGAGMFVIREIYANPFIIQKQ
jgi:predicted NBD/HSP70 family sugar kinase